PLHFLDLHSFPTRRSSDLGVIALVVFVRLNDHYPIFAALRDGMREMDPDVLTFLAKSCGRIVCFCLSARDDLEFQWPAISRIKQDRKSTRLNSSHSQISYA